MWLVGTSLGCLVLHFNQKPSLSNRAMHHGATRADTLILLSQVTVTTPSTAHYNKAKQVSRCSDVASSNAKADHSNALVMSLYLGRWGKIDRKKFTYLRNSEADRNMECI